MRHPVDSIGTILGAVGWWAGNIGILWACFQAFGVHVARAARSLRDVVLEIGISPDDVHHPLDSRCGERSPAEVRVGDDLSAGAKVGTVGSARATGDESTRAVGSALYFEVRRGSNAIDPGPWLGL